MTCNIFRTHVTSSRKLVRPKLALRCNAREQVSKTPRTNRKAKHPEIGACLSQSVRSLRNTPFRLTTQANTAQHHEQESTATYGSNPPAQQGKSRALDKSKGSSISQQFGLRLTSVTTNIGTPQSYQRAAIQNKYICTYAAPKPAPAASVRQIRPF